LAAAGPEDTTPVGGSFFGTVQSSMRAHIEIEV
jgi:hypothetical protein